jgi:ECF transporter S component (folate family)
MKKTRHFVFLSLLIAMDVVLIHMLPVIQVDTLRISFGFVPQMFTSMLFGPVIGGIGAALGDVIGMIVAPKGAYFPGLTLSALLTGVIYGIILYGKPKTMPRILIAVLCVTAIIDIPLNTYWFTIMYGKGFLAMLPARVIKSAILVPVQTGVLYPLWKYAGGYIEGMLKKN